MPCAPSFPPSYTAPSLGVCSPHLHQGPRESPSASTVQLLTLLWRQPWASGAAAPLAPVRGPSTHPISFHIQAQQETTLFHCHFPPATVLRTHGTGKEIHVFESDPIDARPRFKLQQELSTKSVDPFLAESHFKEKWPDKILFL